jgi:hypothetical protein
MGEFRGRGHGPRTRPTTSVGSVWYHCDHATGGDPHRGAGGAPLAHGSGRERVRLGNRARHAARVLLPTTIIEYGGVLPVVLLRIGGRVIRGRPEPRRVRMPERSQRSCTAPNRARADAQTRLARDYRSVSFDAVAHERRAPSAHDPRARTERSNNAGPSAVPPGRENDLAVFHARGARPGLGRPMDAREERHARHRNTPDQPRKPRT